MENRNKSCDSFELTFIMRVVAQEKVRETAQADPLSDGDLSRGGTSLTLMQHVRTEQHLNYRD